MVQKYTYKTKKEMITEHGEIIKKGTKVLDSENSTCPDSFDYMTGSWSRGSVRESVFVVESCEAGGWRIALNKATE